jgi:hypothetical protein
LKAILDYFGDLLRINCCCDFLGGFFLLFVVCDIFDPELIEVASMANRLCYCQVDDVLFVAVDDLAYLVGVSAHHILQSQFLVD